MGRPSDWWVLDLDADPTPGDPFRVRELARRFSELSGDAFESAGEVRRLSGEGGVAEWVGEAGAVFAGAIGEFPGQLDKLDRSYGMVGRALTTYAGELESAQNQADGALVRGRAARDRLETAQGQVAGAEAEVSSASTALDAATGRSPLTTVPASWSTAPPPPPDPAAVTTATTTHTAAVNRLAVVNGQVADAQADVDAERRLALAAKSLRETAASTCKGEIDRASDAGIHNRSWWDKAKDFAANAWDVAVKLANVVIIVAAIAALVLGGPVLWTLVAVAATVVLADTLAKYARGDASLWDVGFAVLNFVPGGKALSLGAGLARGASRLRSLGGALRGGWGTVRNMAGGLRNGARTMATRVCRSDPVDVVSGQVLLAQTDVELPGLLPLLLERAHLSTYRHGRLFGPNWASTLDQRLELDSEGVCLPLADGTVLAYPPPPADGTPVMPVEGVRWPLAADPTGGGWSVTDPQTGRALHFPATDPGVDLTAGQIAILPLATVTDRNGHRIDVDRDPDGTPTAVRHTGGYHVAVDTTDTGQVTALRLVSGDSGEPLTLVRFGYDAGGWLSEVVNSSGLPLRFGYDPDGRLTGWEDRNHRWYSYAYDDTGRCVRTTGPGGFLTGTFTYDPAARTTVATDSLGHQSRFAYNGLGQIVTETDPLGNTVTSVWSRFDWLLSRTDPIGRTWAYRYDELGNLLKVVRPDGAVAQATYDQRSRPAVVVDPDGSRWERAFDEYGNLLAVTDPLGATTSYAYDPDRPGHLTTVTDALGHATRVETNPAGLPTLLVTPSGAVTRVGYGPDGRTTRVLDPVGGTSLYTWTAEGRLAARIAPDGTVESWVYDGEGNPVQHVDPAGLTTRYEYTHFDLPTARTDPDGTRLAFGYDTELRLTSVTNPQGLVWAYTYDPAGRLTAETDFDGRALTYDYDPAGQLVARTRTPATSLRDASGPPTAGQTVTFVRNPLGDVVEKHTPTGTTTFCYDAAGRLVRATSPDVDCHLTRDPLGQVLAETIDGHTVTSAYDPLGRRTRRVTPSGLASDWQWDPDGNPTGLELAGQVVTFTHDGAGRETTRHLGTGLTFTHGWDAAHRLLSQTVTAPPDLPAPAATPPGGRAGHLIHRRTWTYSPDGYPVAVDDIHQGTRRYTLDAARRVTAVSGTGWREKYAYDEAGNVTDATWPGTLQRGDSLDPDVQGTRTYSGTRLRGAGAVRYEHDAQGRVILRQQKRLSAPPRTWRYTWDADDRLVGVVTPDGQRWQYRYDPFGRRVTKRQVTFDGTVLDETRYSWDGAQLAEQQTDSDRHVLAWEWESHSFRPLAQVERTPRGQDPHDPDHSQDRDQDWYDTRFYAIVTDLVGTPTELLRPDGTTVWQHRTTLWGVPTTNPGNTTDCPLRFPGQYHDPESGLDYNVHRHYDPTTARYTSPDPLGLEPAPNPVAYVTNPLTWTDPLGLAPCTTRMRHYTNTRGKDGILSSGVVMASDQNKVFLVPAKGKPLSPRDAEQLLGIGRGRGRHVLDFDVPTDRLAKEYNSTMKIYEWVVRGDVEVTNIRVIR